VLALVVCLGLMGSSAHGGVAPTSPAKAAGTLRLSHAILAGRIVQVDCPSQAVGDTACFRSTTKGVIKGLGAVSEEDLNVVVDPDSDCERWHSNPVLTVAGKGTIELSFDSPGCVVPTTSALNASLDFSVTGGSGVYAGALGSGTVLARGAPGTTNRNAYTLDGSITVSGLVFDLAAPVLHGAVSKTALAPRKAKAVRVGYKVTAKDAVDGPVRAVCKPRPGSRFKIGRTKVTCSAADSSGNRASARFTLTVKRRG
jgi:hypothetical protein